MQCVIKEKIKMLKLFHFPCNHGNQSEWGNQVRKKPILRHFLNYYSHFLGLHRDIYSK